MRPLASGLCAAVAWLALSFPTPAQEKGQGKTIDLGGLRQVKAEVSLDGDEFVIRVQMLPIRSFDDATNSRLNREHAQLLALKALAMHLAPGKTGQLSVSGVTTEKGGIEGQRYFLTAKVPRATISFAEKEKQDAAGQTVGKLTVASALFTRKLDYLQSIEVLTADSFAQLQLFEKEGEGLKERDPLVAMVTALEKRVLSHLETIDAEIGKDLLLLSLEQEELKTVLQGKKRQLSQAVAQVRTRLASKTKE